MQERGFINPLPLIAAWVREHSSQSADMSAVELKKWLTREPYRYGVKSLAEMHGLVGGDLELAVNCLIAAGLGREEDQTFTVYCRAEGFGD